MIVSTQETTHWITVVLDDEPIRKLHRSIFGSADLPKSPSSEEELAAILDKIELNGARQYALKRLAMQAYWSGALRKLMEERGIGTAIIDSVLEECQRYGYINDEEWVNGFIEGQKRKRVGPRMIAQKLRAKGVPEHMYEDSLDEDSPAERLRELIESKYAKRNLSDYKERQKVVASLMRKGYELNDIFAALS